MNRDDIVALSQKLDKAIAKLSLLRTKVDQLEREVDQLESEVDQLERQWPEEDQAFIIQRFITFFRRKNE